MRYDPDIAAEVAMAAGEPRGRDLPLDEHRVLFDEGMQETSGPPQPVDRVDELTIPGARDTPASIYRPAGLADEAPALLFIHGGGWVVGSRVSHDPLCRALANMTGVAVVSIDYRLAPEHRYPAAVEDCVAAARWLVDHALEVGLDPARMAVGGDSAGATLAAVVARYGHDEGWPLAHQLLIYPVTSVARDTESYRLFASDGVLNREDMDWFWAQYLGDEADGTEVDASPLNTGNLVGLPPATVITCELDVLRDEGEAYADRLAKAGVPVICLRTQGMPHGFLNWLTISARARAIAPVIATLVREALSAPPR